MKFSNCIIDGVQDGSLRKVSDRLLANKSCPIRKRGAFNLKPF